MDTQSAVGFDRERFLKLVAMFDSPSKGEAANAFERAWEQLATSKARFCDELVDGAEARRAREESAWLRTELKQALDRCEEWRKDSAQWQEESERMLETLKAFAKEGPERDGDIPPEFKGSPFKEVLHIVGKHSPLSLCLVAMTGLIAEQVISAMLSFGIGILRRVVAP